MYRIFLDTNVLLDYLIEEREGNSPAERIIELIIEDELAGCISGISLLNIFYILRTQKTKKERKAIIENLMDIFDIVSLDYDILQLSLFTEIDDYEDCVQYISAQKACVDYIITGDSRFRQYNLELKRLDPIEFLDILEISN